MACCRRSSASPIARRAARSAALATSCAWCATCSTLAEIPERLALCSPTIAATSPIAPSSSRTCSRVRAERSRAACRSACQSAHDAGGFADGGFHLAARVVQLFSIAATSVAESAVDPASFLTSFATITNPWPPSPRCAASIAALIREQARLARDAPQLLQERADLGGARFHRRRERCRGLDGRHETVQRGKDRVDAAVVRVSRAGQRSGEAAQALRGARDVRRALVDLGERGCRPLDDRALLGAARDDAVELVGVERRDLGGRFDDRPEVEHLGAQPVDEPPQRGGRGIRSIVDPRERDREIPAPFEVAKPPHAALHVRELSLGRGFPHHHSR